MKNKDGRFQEEKKIQVSIPLQTKQFNWFPAMVAVEQQSIVYQEEKTSWVFNADGKNVENDLAFAIMLNIT